MSISLDRSADQSAALNENFTEHLISVCFWGRLQGHGR